MKPAIVLPFTFAAGIKDQLMSVRTVMSLIADLESSP